MTTRIKITPKRILSVLGVIGVVCTVLATSMLRAAQSRVDLGTATDFAVLAGSTITNTGLTTITGDIGLHPGTAVTGYASVVHSGELHVDDSVALGAKTDLVTAYNDAAGRGPPTQIATELGGQILQAGVYNSASGTFGLTGTLTLDAAGDPNAVFIFQMESTLITASASVVNLINGADVCNIVWQVGSSATIAAGTLFKGNILALTSITLAIGARLEGRALARNGAVTMNNNTITAGTCAVTTTPSPTAMGTPTPTPSAVSTPTPSGVPTPTPTGITTPTPTGITTPTPTGVPTPTPSGITTPTPTGVSIPTPTIAVSTPTPSAISTPTTPPRTPLPTPLPAATLAPTPTATVMLTPSLSPEQTSSATATAIAAPSHQPKTSIDTKVKGVVAEPRGPNNEVAVGEELPRSGAPLAYMLFVALGLIVAGTIMRRLTKADALRADQRERR